MNFMEHLFTMELISIIFPEFKFANRGQNREHKFHEDFFRKKSACESLCPEGIELQFYLALINFMQIFCLGGPWVWSFCFHVIAHSNFDYKIRRTAIQYLSVLHNPIYRLNARIYLPSLFCMLNICPQNHMNTSSSKSDLEKVSKILEELVWRSGKYSSNSLFSANFLD